MNRIRTAALLLCLPIAALFVAGCGDDEDDANAVCLAGESCDPDAEGADYCPQDDCNWCSCMDDGTWSCTASACDE